MQEVKLREVEAGGSQDEEAGTGEENKMLAGIL